MTIKQHGGIFGRNPTFNNVEVEGSLTLNGETFSDFGTLAQQDADAVNMSGGTIDGVTIGGSTPEDGTFSTLTSEDGEVYATGNILGTVSEDSGVPTGAIIEQGSNANGQYVRYADGTQIATFLGSANTTGTYPQEHDWSAFPAAFNGAPAITAAGISWRGGDNSNYHYTQIRMAGRNNASSGTGRCQAFAVSQDGGNPTNSTRVYWQAIGRWY